MVKIDPTWDEGIEDKSFWFVKIKDEFLRGASRVEVDKAVARKFGFEPGDKTPFTGLVIEREEKK